MKLKFLILGVLNKLILYNSEIGQMEKRHKLINFSFITNTNRGSYKSNFNYYPN